MDSSSTKDLPMERNVGDVDRTVRMIAGVILLSLVFLLDGNARWWGLLGLVLLVTGLLGWCPAYIPFGIKTCKPGR
jgi:hypothetical protein